MSRLTCARHHLLPHEENFTPHFTGPCLMCVPQTFSAAQAIAPNDESLAMNIKATIVDWHKFIMTQEIVATAAAEARRTGVQWTFNASEGEAVKRSRSPVTSPFTVWRAWTQPLCERCYKSARQRSAFSSFARRTGPIRQGRNHPKQ